jgi:hypothetical protein
MPVVALLPVTQPSKSSSTSNFFFETPRVHITSKMTFNRKQREAFEDLRRKRRIHFRGPLVSAEWPQNHRQSFATIERLGNMKYNEYSTELNKEIGNEPWKIQAKDLATRLTEQAARCHRRNEASWRFACEPLIFARLNAEVTWSVRIAVSCARIHVLIAFPSQSKM